MNDGIKEADKALRMGIFGGSFNPVHKGHISLCVQCCEILRLDKALLIPANIPPHKSSDELCSNHDRYEMLKLSVMGCPKLEVCDIEYRMSGTSYTYHTITQLKKIYPNADFFFIAGADMLEIFDKWYRCNDLLNAFTLVIGARDNDLNSYERLLDLKKNKYGNSNKIQIVNIKTTELSSTLVRNEIRNNKPIEQLVGSAVAKYIYQHGLYK